MKEDTSTSPTTTAGDDLLTKIDQVLEIYGYLLEFQPLVQLLIEAKERMENGQDSGQ